MEDTVTTDAADTPDTPDVEVDESASEETATPEAEPEADDEPVDEDQESEDEPPSAKGKSEAFQKLLAKYGGDYEKMAEAYFEQANSSSRLYKEMQEIKQYLLAKEKAPEDDKKFIEEDPDYKELTGELASLTTEIQETQQAQYGLIATFGRMEKELAKLEGAYERADEVDKLSLRQELSEKRAEMKEAEREFNQNKRLLSQLQANARGLERQKREIVSKVKEARDRVRQQELSTREQARLTRDEFKNSMQSEASKYGIDPASKQFAVLSQSVRDRIANYLRTLPSDAPAIDVSAAVAELTAEYADSFGLKARFQKNSTLKQKITTPIKDAQPVTKGGEPPTKTGKWTAQYAKERARRLLG